MPSVNIGSVQQERSVQEQIIGRALVPLLAIAVFINYVDRGNLATAAPLIKDQLGLSTTELGVLLSAFFWSYIPAQIFAGWLAERINAYRTLALGTALWSLATAASGLTLGFGSLIALRLLLGLGESAVFPCSSKLLSLHLPPERLCGANGLMSTALALGPAFGTFVGGLLMARIGWRSVFLLFGLISLLWLLPWWATTRRASSRASPQSDELAPSFVAIIRRREAWGAMLGHFSATYSLYFVLSWLPLYLVKTRGLSIAHMAEIGGFVYIAYASSSFLIGILLDRWIRAGASVGRVCKTTIICGLAIIAAALPAAAFGTVTVAVASLFCAGFAFGFCTLTAYTIGQTLAGPRAAGKWISLQGSVGNLSGIVAPIVTGVVVDATGQFIWGFLIAAAVCVAGIVAWGPMIREVAPLNWEPIKAAAQ
jgi:MFS family permease